MTKQEIVDYWYPAVRAIYGEYHVTAETCKGLDALLGSNEYYYYRAHWLEKPLPEDVKKLLVMLAGPHGKTILKMYRIRKGLE